MNKTPKKTRIPSPARSQSAIISPRKPSSRRSVGSSSRRSTGYIRLSSLKLSSNLEDDVILSDNTDISRHEKDGSWWRLVERSPFSQEMLEGRRRHTLEDDVMVEIHPAEADIVTQPRSVQNLNLELTSEGSGDNISLISSLNIKQKKLFNKRETLHSDNILKNIMQTQRYSDENSEKNSMVISDEEKTMKIKKKNFFIRTTEIREFPIKLTNDNSQVDPPKVVGKKQIFSKKKINKPSSFEQFMLASSDSEQGQYSGEPDANKSINIDLQKSRKEPREEHKKTTPFFLPSEGELTRRPPSPTDSSVSETIGFDQWRMLPSSTMIENLDDMNVTDKGTPFRKSMRKKPKDTRTSIPEEKSVEKLSTKQNIQTPDVDFEIIQYRSKNLDDMNVTDKGTPFRKSMRKKPKDTRTSIPEEKSVEKLSTKQNIQTPDVDFEIIQYRSTSQHTLLQKETNTNATLKNGTPKKGNVIANSDHQDLDNIRITDNHLQKENDDTHTGKESPKSRRSNRSAHLSNQSLSNRSPVADHSTKSTHSKNVHSSSLIDTSPRRSTRLSNPKKTSISGLQRISIDNESILSSKNKKVDNFFSSADDTDSTIENEATIRYSLPVEQRAKMGNESVKNNHTGLTDDMSVSKSGNKYSSRLRMSTRSPKQKKTGRMEDSPHKEIVKTLPAKSTEVPDTADTVRTNRHDSRRLLNVHEQDILGQNKESTTHNNTQLSELSVQSKGLKSPDSNKKGDISHEKKENNSTRQVGKKRSRQKRPNIEQQSDTINQGTSMNTDHSKSTLEIENYKHQSAKRFKISHPENNLIDSSLPTYISEKRSNNESPVKSNIFVMRSSEVNQSYTETEDIENRDLSTQSIGSHSLYRQDYSISNSKITDLNTNHKHRTLSESNNVNSGIKVAGKRGRPRKDMIPLAVNRDNSLKEKSPIMSKESENENKRPSASLQSSNQSLEIHQNEIESALEIVNAEYKSSMRIKSTLLKSKDISSQPSIKDQQPKNSFNKKKKKKQIRFTSTENNQDESENDETEHRVHQSIGTRSSYQQGFSILGSQNANHTNDEHETMSDSNKLISGRKVPSRRGRPRNDKNVIPMKPNHDISQKEKSVIMSKELEKKNISQNKSLTKNVQSELRPMSLDIVEPLSQVPRSQRRKIVPFLSDKPILLTQEQVIKKIYEQAKQNTQGREKTALEKYLDKIKEDNLKRKQKMDETVSKSLKTTNYTENPNKSLFKPFLAPKKRSTNIKAKSAPILMIDGKPYRTPKMFKPQSWVNKRLYKFVTPKLEPKYKLSSRVRAEKFVKLLSETYTRIMGRDKKKTSQLMQTIAHEMARLRLIRNYVDFYRFCHEYLPLEFGLAAVPDLVNLLPLPSIGVFAPILDSN